MFEQIKFFFTFINTDLNFFSDFKLFLQFSIRQTIIGIRMYNFPTIWLMIK